MWLGGNAPAALDRCGRLGDGWIPALCTPADAAEGKKVIDEVAAAHGRAISPEHFGVSISYAPPGTDLGASPLSALTRRARGRPLDQLIPVGLDGLRALLESFIAVGFSKFIVRPLTPPGAWASRAGAPGGRGRRVADVSERTPADRREAALEFLRRHGAATTPHIFGDLLSHLLGVETLVRSWGGSDILALAALGHATYGTHGFEPYILERDQRSELVDAIGPEAEALVYFYASCDRDAFYPQLTSSGHRLRATCAFRTGSPRRIEHAAGART